MTKAEPDASAEASAGAVTDFSDRLSYSDYLGLDAILTAQHPRSDAHDELLFIIQHQTSELWMQLALHELTAARSALIAGSLRPAFKLLTRVSRIFEQLNNAWDVLRTMTPSDYSRFRDSLGASSGFQSWQYRLIEFTAGNRNGKLIALHHHRADIAAILQAELARPSLYDAAILCLARAGLPVPQALLKRDVGAPWVANPDLQAVWAQVYHQPEQHWELYELAEKLVDFEDYFRRWRFNHVTTVERVIGLKRGTGGTNGVAYLRKMLEVELFPELWHLRTAL